MKTWALLALCAALVQQVTGQDLDTVLERADKLLEQAKAAYEEAREKSSAPTFVEAGFKLEDARIKYIVLQEIGNPEKQKIAAERLRSVNQLAKLIHDGKVAVSGAPAGDAAPKTPEPEAKPGEPPMPIKVVVDVTKRATVPDATKFKDAEKLIKDLYKEQYAKKTQSDRKALARLLLAEAPKNRNDQLVFWVLSREAQDQAVQGCDLTTAMKAIDLAAEVFDIDAMALRNAALAATSKTAKTAEESAGVVTASFSMIDELIANDQYDAADKLVQAMMPLAKKGGNVLVYTQMTNRAKDVADAKGLYQGMKSVQETLAKSPEDPAGNTEMGKFLCFVKGNWDLGIRFLVKGSDAALKTLAEKELGSPLEPSERVVLADAWSDLAQKDKIPLRKGQLLAHARSVYESALPNATGLVRTKIEKRLTELAPAGAALGPGGKAVDLLALIDPAKDQVSGKWSLNGKTLVSPTTRIARLEIPYTPPAEYDLKFVLEKSGSDVFNIGLSDGKFPFTVTFDQAAGGYTTMGKAKFSGEAIPREKQSTIVCQVRSAGVKVMVNGRIIVESSDSIDTLGCNGPWTTPNSKALSIGSFETEFRISEISLIPISGQGKRLR